MCSAIAAAEVDGGFTSPVGPEEEGNALARGAAAKCDAVKTLTPKTVRTGAAGFFATALVEPAGPITVALNDTVKPPTKRATGGAKALKEPTVLNDLDVERLADSQTGGRACIGGVLDGPKVPDGAAEPD